MNFDTAIERVFGNEGGHSNDPNDPGGESRFGISKREYPDIDIRALTRDQAKAIYKRDFYDKIHADELYDGVAYQALDFAVNSGIGTAIRKLQLALNVADDGHWGPITRAAAKTMPESDQIMRLIAYRQKFQTKLSAWDHFGRGWAERNANNLIYGAIDS